MPNFKYLPSAVLSTAFLFSALTTLTIRIEPVIASGCHWTDITCNPHVKPITKPLAEEAWGEAGGSAYPAAANIMRGRNGGSQGLDEFQKRNLRPHFGSLVDQVVVIYNARMMDQWSAFGKSINLSGVDTAGQTYCNRIYIRDSYKPNDLQQIELLAHELVHSRQCRDLGGEGKMGFHYFREFKRAGLNYANNKLEREADSFASQIASSFRPPNLLVSGSPIVSSGGLCLDPKDYGQSRLGNPLHLWTCNGDPAQKWQFTPSGQIVSSGGLCLDPKDYGQSRLGNPLHLWT
jgi:hypothetical protein